MSGTVKGSIVDPDSNVMANCQLFMYRRTDGALLGSAVSDQNGAYELTHTAEDGEKVFVVCLDNDDSPDFEGLVHDRVTIKSSSDESTDPGESTDPEVTYPESAMVLRSSNQVGEVTLSLNKGTHQIDWGDGTIDSDVNGDITHTYTTLAKYDIIVEKTSNEGGTNDNNTMVMTTAMGIQEVVQWYNQGYEVLGFNLSSQTLQDTLVKVPTTAPLVFNTQSQMFMRCSVFNDANIINWDMSQYTDMSLMFFECHAFNQPIGTWDFSNKENLASMFYNCSSFNQDLGMINVSNVANMGSMFYGATLFDQDLSKWCVTNITEEPGSFRYGSALTDEHCPVWGTCPNG
ncbi:BspA family leucine-rich repeat surface protein [Acinetobacter sp. MB5]|uniref:BspA family leucine-rich repeat surface protein n=1 Tax=Acinetobacter sp. MB5 TaxID=2069438 RepID=UPI000DCF73CC|nr:BspA family leucine-rich repeat surface protein [Acinetobacter sp. MB5]